MQPVDFGPRRGPEGKMMKSPGLATIDGLTREGASWRGDRKAEARMLVRHDVLLVPLDDGATSVLEVKAQEWKQPVVERYGRCHVSDGDFYVVDERFHRQAYIGDVRQRDASRPVAVLRSRSATSNPSCPYGWKHCSVPSG